METTFNKIISLMFLFAASLYSEVEIKSITSPSAEILQYKMVQIKIKLKIQHLNYFDVNEVSVKATIESPSGKVVHHPCYYNGKVTEDSIWKLRFTPVEVGLYHYYFQIKAGKSRKKTKTFSVNVVKSEKDGFIRQNTQSYFTFQFDSGKPFRGIGENIAWAEDYEYYFQKLKENQCNVARIWMCPWNLYLEWKNPGLGKYNMKNAARLDTVLQLAKKYQIYLILCLDYHGVVQRDQGYFKENKWDENPYNIKNGGPCKSASEFFTHPVAKQFYKNRLLYIVARYSFSPQILAWEFWNEVDLTAGKPDEVIRWHEEMAAFLKSIDPYKHLITTSFSGEGYSDMWKIHQIDFSQTHHYNQPDFTSSFPETILLYEKRFQKPHVVGEFGVDFRGAKETRENDPENIGLHNGLWAGLFSPTPILPLTWWWDTIIDADSLYSIFYSVANFGKDMIESNNEIILFWVNHRIVHAGDEADLSDNLVLFPHKPWGKNTEPIFRIKENGLIQNKYKVPSFLFGSEKKGMRQPPTFKIHYQNDGKFRVHVNHVSGEGMLRIFLDEKLAFEQPLRLAEENGDWEERIWREEWSIYQGLFNKVYEIDVPAGFHAIRVQNDGIDWLEIVSYQFINCGVQNLEVLNVMGIRQKSDVYLWIRHEESFWKNVRYQGEPRTIVNAKMNVPLLSSGEYRIVWWDTYQGREIQSEVVHFSGRDSLLLEIPDFRNDIACKIVRR